MIKNYKQYNESLRDLMVGPTEDEVWSSYMNGKLKGLLTSIPESTEDFFNKIKDGCVEISENKNGTFFGKNGIKLFQQDSKNRKLLVSTDIWSVFENIYELNYIEIRKLIKSLLVNDINLNGLTPYRQHWTDGWDSY